ncbi:hypothetical protein ANO11243_049450 [Dothideomycetidae sp. 11243]|nr:hypothetical protein ANO11243_049450 [fungal sp. No.11243]
MGVLGVWAWKFKPDGLLHHKLFQHRNLIIAAIAVFIEGMAFMASAYYFPYAVSVVHGNTMNSFEVSLCYMIAFPTFIVAALTAALFIYKTRTVRLAGIFTFASFLAFFITMSTITPETPAANFWGYIVFYGTGLGVCLVTFVTAAQFATPPELISTTSGFVLTVRSLGGSIGLAIFNALFYHGLDSDLVPNVVAAIKPVTLSEQQLETLLGGLMAGNKTLIASVPGLTPTAIEAAGLGVVKAYITGFHDVFICGAALSAVGIIAAFFLIDPKSEFTHKIDAPIDVVQYADTEKSIAGEDQSDCSVTHVDHGRSKMGA